MGIVKVYEVMNKLAEMPAGAEVRINMVKSLNEMPKLDDNLRQVNFEVMEINQDGDEVEIDGW